jgi:ABC-type glycerol-3-phosphate transport system substrate-binding protein
MQRKIGTIEMAVILLVGCIGCRGTLPPDPPPEFQGQTVRVACPEELRDLVAAQSRAWEARHEARVEVVTSPAGDPAADAYVFAPADLPRLVADGRLRPIPPELKQRDNDFVWDRLLPQYGEQMLLWEGVAYAVPVVGEAPLCVYRADLFDSPEWKKKYAAWRTKHPPGAETPLRPPSSWEEFADLAAFFRDEHPSGEPGPSLPPLPADADALERRFFQVAASYARRAVRRDAQQGADYRDDVFSFAFDQKTGASRIASKGFVHALEMLAGLQSYRPGGTNSAPEDALIAGRAVLGIVEASAVAKLQRSAFRDKIGVCAVPGAEVCYDPRGVPVAMKQGVNRVPYLGGAGWLAGVNPSSERSAAAMDLLADLAGPARSAQIAQETRWGGGPTRADVLLRDRWDSFDLDAGRTAALRETLSRTLLSHLENPAGVVRLADRRAFRDALVAGIRRSLLEKGKADESLGEVDREWKRLIEKRGAAAHRKDYRLGLGLRAD